MEKWGPPQAGPNSLDLGQGKLQALSSISEAGSGLEYLEGGGGGWTNWRHPTDLLFRGEIQRHGFIFSPRFFPLGFSVQRGER